MTLANGRLELIARYSGRLVSNQPGKNKRNPSNYAITTLNKGKSALAQHVCDTKHKFAWENSKVI